MTIPFVRLRHLWYLLSVILTVVSIAVIPVFGFRYGLDFTGGSLLELDFGQTPPSVEEVHKALEGVELGTVIIQPSGNQGMLLRFQSVDEAKHQEVIKKIKELAEIPTLKVDESGKAALVAAPVLQELRFESIGPVIGAELQRRALIALVVTNLAIIVYIAYAFRKVSKPVLPWVYGLTAIVALVHDVCITTGFYVVYSHYTGAEVDALFITALLTVLGFSVHDTIVVFDRTRENLARSHNIDDVQSFDEVVNRSVNQTLARSIGTTLTAVLVLLALYLYGGESTKHFVLTLIFGISVGTYSSVFIASPLLTTWNRFAKKLSKIR